jgi:hypothetical protein
MRAIARLLLPVVLAVVSIAPLARGGDEGLPQDEHVASCCADEGIWSAQFIGGYYVSSGVGPAPTPYGVSDVGRSRIDYVPLSFRAGYELPKVWLCDTCLAGRVEGLVEYDYFPILRQFGSYFTGPAVLGRYNFLHPEGSLFTPYIQAGAGLLLTDAYRTQSQRLIGRWQEFLLQTAVGGHYALTEQVSFDVETGLQHISNARLGRRNGGINDIGLTVGVTYRFGTR